MPAARDVRRAASRATTPRCSRSATSSTRTGRWRSSARPTTARGAAEADHASGPRQSRVRHPGCNGLLRVLRCGGGRPDDGYYSFEIGPMALHRAQLELRRGRRAATPAPRRSSGCARSRRACRAACTLAYWHHPRFSSGQHGERRDVCGRSGRRSTRRAPTSSSPATTTTTSGLRRRRRTARSIRRRGIREFVVGTGGRSLRAFRTVRPNASGETRSSFGVLELTLGVGTYAWRFVPAVGSFTDSGSETCH